MADTAAHLVDHVLPRPPYRQWVFTVPKALRLARDLRGPPGSATSPRVEYAATRPESLPIGSGNVEATRKRLVTVRMKRPGARWKHTTGDEVMQLRALQLSDRSAAAVQRATRPLAKSVQIVGGLSVRPAANANRSAALSASGRGVRAA